MSFRHEKNIERGGPDGGDGGDGGDVILLVNKDLNTLVDFKFRQHFKAGTGQQGMGARKHGRNGEDEIIQVPLGTIARDAETGEILADMSEPGDKVVIAKGGRGGRGNVHFATATNQAPRRSDYGGMIEECDLTLELKLLADVGLVGFPNAGKSTLLSRVSHAHPKIADYPFTTLQPNLGIVKVGTTQSLVMADIPGIIEGAHEGKGLGFRFLRHIERTKILLFLVECMSEDIEADYKLLLNEIASYSEKLLKKPRILAVTKTDVLPPGETPELPDLDIETIVISSVKGEGLDKLVYRLGDIVESLSDTD